MPPGAWLPPHLKQWIPTIIGFNSNPANTQSRTLGDNPELFPHG